MTWHDTFDDMFATGFDEAAADEKARVIAEDFRQNVGESFSVAWGQEPWTKFFFDPNTPFSFMVSVKEFLEKRLGSDAKEVKVDFDGRMILVR